MEPKKNLDELSKDFENLSQECNNQALESIKKARQLKVLHYSLGFTTFASLVSCALSKLKVPSSIIGVGSVGILTLYSPILESQNNENAAVALNQLSKRIKNFQNTLSISQQKNIDQIQNNFGKFLDDKNFILNSRVGLIDLRRKEAFFKPVPDPPQQQ